jgi:mRNA-degrading endonuclease toxin of MazEF toxin-antitoxin module
VGLYYFGQIIYADIDDGKGGIKNRPAVIISSDSECGSESEVLVIAITKRIEDPCPPYHYQVHEGYARDPYTGLDFPCVAKCNWARQVRLARITRRVGNMPDGLLQQIVETFDRLYNDESFED